ncbi:ketopantoate reductase family protein [Geomicrobium sediminis]|uniref:2-dehydropantoate 2-reductase n=2 Tax=Geomicrobium TaxID=767528 RepID=A0ABS2PBE3_9BACL|nr:ketopantoate reductase family protein [Geomicrobium sediminis]MBM7632733.1 2-dehydropantoate 2-reductase [Geomicrobium sediminis]
MKLLVIGAGAVGGYFGGRLFEAEKDVTFLVREQKRQQLQKTGLIIESPHGNINIHPPLITTKDSGKFDVILLTTKAYHLEQAIQDFKPFMHDKTIIIPLLNGIAHLETLESYIPKNQVFGGVCFIESTLKDDGTIVHHGDMHTMLYGPRNEQASLSTNEVEQMFQSDKSTFALRENIDSDMWQKYMLITVLSGTTTLFDANIGQIKSSQSAMNVAESLITEVATVIERIDPSMDSERLRKKAQKQWDNLNASFKASMQRDTEKGLAVEADHIPGYLYVQAKAHQIDTPYLEVVYGNLQVYEQKRKDGSL